MLTLFISSPASSSSWLKVEWLWNHMHRRIQSTCFKPLASGAASECAFDELWEQLRVGCFEPSGGFNVPRAAHANLACQSPGHCAETLQNGAQGSHALPPPGPSRRWTCTFNLMLFFLPSAGTYTQNYYYLLVTACCWFIRRGKCNFVLTPLPCHLRHMLMKDRFWHPVSSAALRPQYIFIINEDATVILFLFVFITTPKPSCRYLCASQIPNHIPRNAQYFMLELALMWHSCTYNVLNKDVFTHILLLTLSDHIF